MRSSLKCLTIFLVFAVLLGLAMVIVGIWALADETTPIYAARLVTTHRVQIIGLSMSLIAPIVFGLLTIIPFGLILYGVIKKDLSWEKLLGAYIIILMVIIIIEVPVGIIPMAYLSSQTATDLKAGLATSLNVDYRGLPNSYTDSHTNSLTWDNLMIRYSCCGINGVTDFSASYGLYASTWYTAFRSYQLSNGTTYTTQVKLPTSCCALRNKNVLTTKDYLNMRSYLVSELCPLDIRFSVNSNGCYNVVFSYVTSYTIAIVCVMIFHLVCLVASFIFGIYLLCKILDGDDEVYYAHHHTQSSRVGPMTPKYPVHHQTKFGQTRMYDNQPYSRGR